MKILAAASRIATAFEQMGHEVLRVWNTDDPVLNVAALCEEKNFAPDLVFQQESLGARTLLAGLDSFDCPRIFWSIDTHLNLTWHRHYAKLFDGVMTPHMTILSDANIPMPPARRLAWPGLDMPWVPFAERTVDAAFVGRLEGRPVRKWLVEFLRARYPAPRTVRAEDNLSGQEMMELYADTRLAPNESIMAEVNFRLVEGASAGCLVLSPNVGEDQDAQFVPGEEIVTYSHVLHLQELMDRYMAAPAEAEKLARAAWERVQREHLPEHRAAEILDFARGLTPGAARGHDADRALRLALLEMARTGMTRADPVPIAARIAALEPTPEAVAALMRFAAQTGDSQTLANMVEPTLVGSLYPGDIEVNLAGSMAGLLTNDWDMAKQFWYRHQRAARPPKPRKPETPYDLCHAWAQELMRAGRTFSFGGKFSAGQNAPLCAVDCLEYALHLKPEDRETIQRLEAALSTRGGLEYMRLGRLSNMTLHEPENWRAGLTLGMVNLKVFRDRQGLEELLVAHKTAAGQGRESSFGRMLRGMDPSGTASKALDTIINR